MNSMYNIYQSVNISTYLLITFITALFTLSSYLHFNEYYGNTIADPAYYYAQGQSLHEYGELKDITVIPHQPPLNAHLAIGLIHYGYAMIWDDPISVFRYSPWIGLLLFLASWFPLRYIGRRHFYLPDHWIAFIFLFLAASPVYMHYSLIASRTEAWFFPLVLLWSAVFLHWQSNQSRSTFLLLLLVLFLSILLYMFRIQGAIVMLAGILGLLWTKHYKKAGGLAILTIASVSFVLVLNSSLSGITVGEGETGHFSNISTFSTARLLAFIPVIGQFFFNHDHTLIAIPFGILGIFVLLLYSISVTYSGNYAVRFAGLLTLGSLAALLLFRTEEDSIQLRYIYYALPLFLLSAVYLVRNCLGAIQLQVTKTAIITLIAGHLLLFGYRNIINYDQRMELLSTSKERYYQLSDIYTAHEPKGVYHDGSKESERLWYVVMNEGVKLSNQCMDRPESLLITNEYLGNRKQLSSYYIHDQYYIYRLE